MINTYHQLKKCLKVDAIANEQRKSSQNIKDQILYEHHYLNWKYIKLLRKDEYYSNNKKGINMLLRIYYRRKKNKLGEKLGFTIPPNVFDEGLRIWHFGNIVVNGYARVGKNCILHGDNCIGNDGLTMDAPIIGDNVDIGVGAKIIGNVRIGNNVIIGANAVVTRSFEEDNIVIAGVPARKIRNIDSEELACVK